MVLLGDGLAGNIGDGPLKAEAAIDESAEVDEFPSIGIALAAIELDADPSLIRMYGTAEVVAE